MAQERIFADEVRTMDPIFFIFVGMVLGFLITAIIFNSEFLSTEFIDGLAPEAVGILLTVGILDRLSERRARRYAEEQRNQQLIRQLRSTVNSEAKRAAEELRDLELLESGLLRDQNLSYANLEGVNFGIADLRGTQLRGANLKNAILASADLDGAELNKADLRGANLQNASLKHAMMYGWRGKVMIDFPGGQAILDEHTKLPNDTIYKPEDGIEQLHRFTDPRDQDFYDAPAHRPPTLKELYPDWDIDL
jgi:hypothetical protein